MSDNRATEEQDVNSDVGFLSFLARQTEKEIPEGQLDNLESHDTKVSHGLTEESATEPDRDGQGRFTPAAPPAEEVEEGAAPVESTREEEVDPAIAEFLAKHDGNTETAFQAALREAREAQTLIGRQGMELGEERKARQEMAERLAKLEGRLEAQPPQQVNLPLVNDDTVEALENMLGNSGAKGMMGWVVNNRPDLIETAEEVWAAEDPLGASGFRARRVALEVANQSQAQAPQPDEFLESLRRERQMGETVGQIRSGMSEPEWNAVSEHLVPLLEDEATPGIIKNAVVSDDANTRLQGITALVQLARGRAITAATATVDEQRAKEAAAKKTAAQVATGSLRPVQERKPEDGTPESSEEIAKRFHEKLLGTSITSVQDGLVFGK